MKLSHLIAALKHTVAPFDADEMDVEIDGRINLYYQLDLVNGSKLLVTVGTLEPRKGLVPLRIEGRY
ncbi:MAG TPA: hypothetical protein VM531_09065 [Sphingomicrobium sp.]|jgi:hypothetical protein|nr:hypothetical protein [Sphingomicrobium sp.]